MFCFGGSASDAPVLGRLGEEVDRERGGAEAGYRRRVGTVSRTSTPESNPAPFGGVVFVAVRVGLRQHHDEVHHEGDEGSDV